MRASFLLRAVSRSPTRVVRKGDAHSRLIRLKKNEDGCKWPQVFGNDLRILPGIGKSGKISGKYEIFSQH